MPIVHFLRVLGSKQNESTRMLQERSSKQQEKSLKAYLYTNQLNILPPNTQNSTKIHVTFEGAQCRRIAEKQQFKQFEKLFLKILHGALHEHTT